MPVHQIVATSPRLDELIYEVAASMKDEKNGDVKVSTHGGIIVKHNKSNESTALAREYITNLVIYIERLLTCLSY